MCKLEKYILYTKDLLLLYVYPTKFVHTAVPTEMSRKHVSQMFYRGEVENEARERPQVFECLRFTSDSDVEVFMKAVESRRTTELYAHTRSEVCTLRGKDTTYYVRIPLTMFLRHGVKCLR